MSESSVDREYALNAWPDHPIAVTRAVLVKPHVERAIGIADYVYILQKGDVIFVGEPSQCASGVVLARYLGASA